MGPSAAPPTPAEPAGIARVLVGCVLVLGLAAGLNPSVERHRLALVEQFAAASEPAYHSLGLASYTTTGGGARLATIGAFGLVHVFEPPPPTPPRAAPGGSRPAATTSGSAGPNGPAP